MGSEAPGAASDRELWQCAGDGDSTALGEISERYAKAVYNHLFLLIWDWSQPEVSNRARTAAGIARHSASRNPES